MSENRLRRVLLGGLVGTVVGSVLPPMRAPSYASSIADNGLLGMWNERNRIMATWNRLDETVQPTLHAALDAEWNALDNKIVIMECRSLDDLRAKVAFMRDWMRNDREPDQGGQMINGMLDDLERMFLRARA